MLHIATACDDLHLPSDLVRVETIEVPVAGRELVDATLDRYSDRLRCDHPQVPDGEALGQALRHEAEARGAGRIVVLAEAELKPGLEASGFSCEALMPGFYLGHDDCAVMGLALDAARETPCDPDALRRVDAILACQRDVLRPPPEVETALATPDDAPGIAGLIGATFESYPTPSGDPDYIADAIDRGIPFRLVREAGDIVACASADLVPSARTAELTDCATRPDQRGRGLMRALLSDLVKDLEAMDYPTAFTLARAVEPGINIAFQRLGFQLQGRMTRSCRIGSGLEDMNVWSRRLGA